MPRKTAAERQKQYREKLKILNPEKYKELKQKTAARALEYYRKKQRALTEEQKEEQRLRRREKEQNAKNAQSETQENDSDHLLPKPFQRNRCDTRNSQRRNEQKGRKEIRELQDSITVRNDIMTTDGGTYEPVLSTVDAKILSIMGDQEPLSNSCDSAFKFYKNVEDVIICDVSKKPTETFSSDVTNTSDDTSDDNDTSNKASYIYLGKIQKKIMVPKNKIIVKKTYYENKMKSPSLEEKIKLSEYSLILKKHKLLDLEIKIKQKEYENMIK